MRTLARAAITSLRVQSAGLGLVVVVVAVLGVLGTHASARLGNQIAGDELTTSTATGQLAWDSVAYRPVSTHLGRLLAKEQSDGRNDQVAASANAAHTTGFIIGAAMAGLLICLLLLLDGIRRIHRNLEPGEERAEFTDTLQVANGEDEAHQLLRHHLERTLPGTSAVVLNRNNSADRLEAVTPLPGGSPLAQTLRGAEPRSCLAVRTGQTHRENERRAPLLSCPVCASCPGASACVPLTVGGEVMAPFC